MKRLLACLWALAALAAHAASISVQVLDKDGQPVADAVVVAVSAGGSPARPAPLAATILQEKMQFVPAVTVVQAGARVTFTNNDAWEHHVRGSGAGVLQFSSGNSGGFELRLDGKGEGRGTRSAEVVLDKPGPLLLGCHIHGSMRGFIYVSDSPWAARTGADGLVSFDGMADGPVQLRVWHPEQLIDLPPRSLVAGSVAQRLEVRLQVVPRRRRI